MSRAPISSSAIVALLLAAASASNDFGIKFLEGMRQSRDSAADVDLIAVRLHLGDRGAVHTKNKLNSTPLDPSA